MLSLRRLLGDLWLWLLSGDCLVDDVFILEEEDDDEDEDDEEEEVEARSAVSRSSELFP